MSKSDAARTKWAGIIREQRESGQSVARYCAGRGIPASSLFSWKRKLAGTEPAFVEAKVRGADVEHGAAVGGIRIELACGRHVTVARGFDRRLLLEVLDALESGAGEGS